MHVVLAWQKWLALLGKAFLVLTGLSLLLHQDKLGEGWKVWFSILKDGVSWTTVLTLAVVTTPTWRLLWLWPGFNKKLPIPDGRWTGVQSSNWPVLDALRQGSRQARKGLDVDDEKALPELLDTPVEVDIITTFFSIRMDLRTGQTDYLQSKLRAAVLIPATDLARGRLTYVFEATVRKPKGSDEGKFDGAADLDIHSSPAGRLSLEGPMWTTRKWRQGLNTAGCIKLERVESWVLPEWLRPKVKSQ